MCWRRPRVLTSALLGVLLLLPLLSACAMTAATSARPGTLRWRVQITDGQRASQVFEAHGVVYLGGRDHTVYALDAATGAQRWRVQLGVGFDYVAAVADGLVYVMTLEHTDSAGRAGTYGYVIYALDAATGAQRWQAHTGGFCCSALAVADGVVYVGTEDDFLYALDGQSGAERWRAQVGSSLLSTFATPTVLNGVVYLGSFDHNVYALDAATGQHRWQFQTGDRIVSGPVVANGVVYVSATESDHTVYALDAATGKLRWRYQISGLYFSPVVANGVAYVGSNDGFLYALNI